MPHRKVTGKIESAMHELRKSKERQKKLEGQKRNEERAYGRMLRAWIEWQKVLKTAKSLTEKKRAEAEYEKKKRLFELIKGKH